jgi:ABC-type nitrate/sulfonate/bicarbonate transport system permease component
VEFLRPIPSVAIIPLAILLFGIDREASLVIVVFATFWQIFIQVLYGVADVDPVARDTQRSFGLSAPDRFRHLVLPTALPYIMTGIRLGATVALILTVTGELIIGVEGIGRLLVQRGTAADYAGVYALVVTAGLLALVINTVVRIIERRVLAWHESVRAEVVL